jgi:hypothetical protein
MSFCEEIRRAVMAVPRMKLPEIRAAMYKAFASGQITEAEAETLDALINAKAVVPATEKPPQRRVGSKPRSSASMERRRSWAAAGRLPPALAARFTLGETAVLAVIAAEMTKRGACTLAIGHIAALAGVCATTVKNALRAAHSLGLIRIEERRLTAWRNLPNLVTITSPEWLSWLRIGPKGGGGKFVPGTHTDSKKWPRAEAREHHALSLFRQQQRPAKPEEGYRHSRGGL